MYKYAEGTELFRDLMIQSSLLLAAGTEIAVPFIACTGAGYIMELGEPLLRRMNAEVALRVPLVTAQLRKLWALPEMRAGSAEGYADYVLARRDSTNPQSAAEVHAAFNTSIRLKPAPGAEKHAFVHGDATLANVVVLDGGLYRLIDFSPHASPGDPELDVAKLLFSAMHEDFEREPVITRAVVDEFKGSLHIGPGGDVTISDRLTAYYFYTHIVRVGSREPGKRLFYEYLLETVRYKEA